MVLSACFGSVARQTQTFGVVSVGALRPRLAGDRRKPALVPVLSHCYVQPTHIFSLSSVLLQVDRWGGYGEHVEIKRERRFSAPAYHEAV